MNKYNAFLINIINEIEVSLKKSVSNMLHGGLFHDLDYFLASGVCISKGTCNRTLSFIVNKKISLSFWTNFKFVLGQFLFYLKF